MAVLCFRLFGPLAAWGTSEVGNGLRPSQRHPSRGAVLGLLAAALGIAQEDAGGHTDLGRSVVVAVASHGRRRIVDEFRTSQEGVDPKKVLTRRQALERGASTTLTTRQSVEDGLWRVFVAATSPDVDLDGMASALAHPAFGLFLGRKEYPMALPPGARVLEGGLDAALAGFPVLPQAHLDMKIASPGFGQAVARHFVDGQGFELRWDVGFPGAPQDHTDSRSVADDPFDRVVWSFRERRELRRHMDAPSEVAMGNVVADRTAMEFYDQEVA